MSDPPSSQRRLAAVMFTDLVGFSALTRRDEALALRLLEEHRRLLRSVFTAHGGREVKTLGDGFMLEFPNALGAVRAGLAIQETIRQRNAEQSATEVIRLRIGIHLGDVEYRDGDLLGDGVNIAARIEPLAGAGEICLSEDVARQVRHHLEFSLTNLGPQQLKNIDEAVTVFRIGANGGVASDAPDTREEALSIAVLPFTNISADPADEYFSDGMSEELINSLSRVPGLRVAARTSAFSFKNSGEDIATISARLKVQRLLEGSVRKAGRRLRITAQLIDAADGYPVWSGRYDRELDDVFAIQEEIAGAITHALRMTLPAVRGQSDTRNLRAFDLYLLGRDHMYRRTPEDLAIAIDRFRQAVQLDPDYGLAWTGITTAFALATEYSEMPISEALHQTVESRRKAMQLAPELPETHAADGVLRWFQGKLPDAAKSLHRAVALNPNFSLAHMWLGNVLVSRGLLTEGLEEFRVVRELDPLNTANLRNIALVLLRTNNLDEATEVVSQVLEHDPHDSRAYWILAEGHVLYGRLEEACRWGQQALDADAEASSRVRCYGARAIACTGVCLFDAADQAIASARALVPRSTMIAEIAAETHFLAGAHERMLETTREWLAESAIPEQGPLSQRQREAVLWTGLASMLNGIHDQAIGHLERAFEPAHQYSDLAYLEVGLLSLLAHVYASSGDDAMGTITLDRALAAWDWVSDHGADDPLLTLQRAALYLQTGDHRLALEWLGRAVAQGWRSPGWLEQDPRWASAKSDPPVAALLQQMHADIHRAAASGC
ncbi:MAG: tetratricopeptide repeat protein [Gammaproteobacteria bacterium]|jgi:adenylate cyclase|nr:tetratricopeptide repeat protein [Gammaproteobacteria bacterium]